MKAIQDKFFENEEDSVAFVIFNVKGRDLMAIDKPCEDMDEYTTNEYINLGISPEPFKNVKYFIPYSAENSAKQNTYLSKDDIHSYIDRGNLKKFKYVYADDKESIEMLFAEIDDPTQTMDCIISKIIDENDPDFGKLQTWNNFIDKVQEKSQKGSAGKGEDVSVMSWRKFKRVVRKAIINDDMFAQRAIVEKNECRLSEDIKKIKKNNVFVIDIAKLPEDKQSFVFGDALRTIYNLKLGEYDAEDCVGPPKRIIVFIDELNKYASKDAPKASPILRQLLDITERGRSLGVILFGVEQFRSAIHNRITGNCATHAYGRTNSIETSAKDYSSLPETYKNMLTRLEQGDYLIQNPVFRSLLKIQFPKPIYKQFK
jgi:DNA helicase HerA-like ATPase